MTWYKIKDNIIDFTTSIDYCETLGAAKITVESIMNNYKPPYYLLVSGGVDSQAMLYAWKLFGKDYIPTTGSYNHGLNDHDIVTMKQFCSIQNIELNVINFDLLKFYEAEYEQICYKYRCTSPHFGAHYGMAKDLPGTVIFSGDMLAPNAGIINSANIWLLDAAKDRSMVPFFFLETPELAYAMLYENIIYKHDYTLTLAENIYNKKVYKYYLKPGFQVIPQPQKYTGFEKVKDYYDLHYSHLVTKEMKRRFLNMPSKRTYDILLRYPYEKMFGTVGYTPKINYFRGY